MVETEDLKRIIKVCMFDQYGTVVDMQRGLTEIATPYLEAKGWTGNPYSFVTWMSNSPRWESFTRRTVRRARK